MRRRSCRTLEPIKRFAPAFPEPVTRRHYAAALLFWVGTCLVYSSVLLVNLRSQGLHYLETPEGHSATAEFLRSSFLYPGLVLTCLLLIRSRNAAWICAMFAAFYAALAVAPAISAGQVVDFPPLGAAALCGAAAVLARVARRAIVDPGNSRHGF